MLKFLVVMSHHNSGIGAQRLGSSKRLFILTSLVVNTICYTLTRSHDIEELFERSWETYLMLKFQVIMPFRILFRL